MRLSIGDARVLCNVNWQPGSALTCWQTRKIRRAVKIDTVWRIGGQSGWSPPYIEGRRKWAMYISTCGIRRANGAPLTIGESEHFVRDFAPLLTEHTSCQP